MDLSEAEYEEAIDEFSAIEGLVGLGVLGSKTYKETGYWCWPVLQPELVPEWLRLNYFRFREIRWYDEK